MTFPFNADFTVAIRFPPRHRFPTPGGEPYYFTPPPFRGAAPPILQIRDSGLGPSRPFTLENEKKRTQCPRPVVSHGSTTILRAAQTHCAEHALRARLFLVIAGWLREQRRSHNFST